VNIKAQIAKLVKNYISWLGFPTSF